MQKTQIILVSALEKIFPDETPRYFNMAPLSGFQNEVLSFQMAVYHSGIGNLHAKLEVISPIKEYIKIRRVLCVPVRGVTYEDADGNYLHHKQPGMYPDALTKLNPDALHFHPNQWESLWIDIESENGLPVGKWDIKLRLTDNDGNFLEEKNTEIEVLPGELPSQKFIHTKWLHTDCLSSYYHVPVFSEEYWRITENFVRQAVKRGINMIYTPIHTPPLDTKIGGERPTVQLVDIRLGNSGYEFGFDKLGRWVEMCRRCGAEYFEMAHLFTQWGAKATPKILVEIDGKLTRIFGWDVSATSDEYREFVSAYLPALREELRKLGIEKKCYFHISDEPSGEKDLKTYCMAKEVVMPYLHGVTVMDALSDVEYYRTGVVEHPIPACNHIENFLPERIENMWTYYCCGQYKDVTNTFIAMPSERTRIAASLFYKDKIAGLLQWGYNFYYAMHSTHMINPWVETDSDGFGPAGDSFQVYPEMDGTPAESIRMMVFAHALQDLRAMEWLEQKFGRDHVIQLLHEELGDFDWKNYPHRPDAILQMREKINRELIK